MDMRKILIYTLTAAGLTLSACEKDLDINPQQQLSTELIFNSKSTATGSLIGVYGLAQDLEVFGSMPQVIADFQSDNVDFVGSFPTLNEIKNYTTLSDNSSIQTLWRDNYFVILAANAVIANVPGVADDSFTDEEKAQLVAEAKFIRAFVNFQMVNLFAQPYQQDNGGSAGIPLVTEPFSGEVELPSRATVNEVHQAIITDLTEALPDLPESYDSPDQTRGRATKGAASALLSRIHLYRGEWQVAADFADDVIGSSVYMLASNYSFYSGNTSEEVFSLQNSATDNGATGSGGWSSFYEPAEQGGRGDAPFSEDLIAAFELESGDLRYAQKEAGVNGKLYTLKFNDAVTNTDNVPLIRVTEMYLNRAEALAELNGINAESIDLINELRERADLGDWAASDFANDEEFLDAIAIERRKELCFEGHRRMDLLRRGKALRPVGSTYYANSQPGADKTIMPIPQRERDLNPTLSQNTGYGN
jgi:starch-binding outer membrane protein, SusD/RagB family